MRNIANDYLIGIEVCISFLSSQLTLFTFHIAENEYQRIHELLGINGINLMLLELLFSNQ